MSPVNVFNVCIGDVETGVPLPSAHTGRQEIYPLSKMGPGQSFLVSGKNLTKEQTNLLARKLNSRVKYWQNKLAGTKFACRQMEGGVRVFRVQ